VPTRIVRSLDTAVLVPSETVSRATYWLGAEYMCVGFACVDVPPSPNVHEEDSGNPSGSEDPALQKVTGCLPGGGRRAGHRHRRPVAEAVADAPDRRRVAARPTTWDSVDPEPGNVRETLGGVAADWARFCTRSAVVNPSGAASTGAAMIVAIDVTTTAAKAAVPQVPHDHPPFADDR
jgi:hypothetical protein